MLCLLLWLVEELTLAVLLLMLGFSLWLVEELTLVVGGVVDVGLVIVVGGGVDVVCRGCCRCWASYCGWWRS